MREAGRIHALALLRENTGNLLGACELWCGLADGKRTEVELREGSFLSGLAGGEEERQRKAVLEARRARPRPPDSRGQIRSGRWPLSTWPTGEKRRVRKKRRVGV